MKSSSLMRWVEGKLMVGLCLALMLAVMPMAALGQTPYMVKDINTTQDVGSSNPTSFTQVGTKTFFVTQVPGEGYQLWKTDGTAAGTTLVTNQYFPGISSMTSSNGKLFFMASTSFVASSFGTSMASGAQALWTSDGTAAGTFMLRQASNGLIGHLLLGSASAQAPIADVNGTLFFASDDGTSGAALWKTDGTVAGTAMVKALPSTCEPMNGEVCFSSPMVPTSLTAVQGTLFFTASPAFLSTSSANAPVLWKSDGTEAGTVVLKPGSNLAPANLTNVNGVLFFAGTDLSAGSGVALWRSDGTDDGTVEVAGVGSGSAQELTNVNGTLFFSTIEGSTVGSSAELWRSDGTTAGTAQVTRVCQSSNPATTTNSCARVFYLTNVNGTLFYANFGGLWKSDGTAVGTVQIAAGISPSSLVALNGSLYFGGYDPTNGTELWKSDGTAAGTGIVKDICPGSCSSMQVRPGSIVAVGSFGSSSTTYQMFPSRLLTVSNGKLFFAACEPVNDCEPWTSDGTNSGTYLLKNIVPNTSSQITEATDLNGSLLFFAFDGHSTGLWKSDGTDAGTAVVEQGVAGYQGPAGINGFVTANNIAYFAGSDPTNGPALWRTDGTLAGTAMVEAGLIQYLTSLNNEVVFLASDGANGLAIWKSDGTSDGTVVVKDFPNTVTTCTGSVCAFSSTLPPTELTPVGGTLFFEADDGTGVSGLWKSDGTAAGTVLVKSFPPQIGSYCVSTGGCPNHSAPNNLTAVGGTLFFVSNDSLWKSDGTADGTAAITGALFIDKLVDVNGTAFFTSGSGLWKSDGTAVGTVMVSDLMLLTNSTSWSSSSSDPMINVNGTLFLVQNNMLFKSDGTPNGTVLVTNVPASNAINGKGTLYFAGHDANGTELWKSDGTEAGTVMVVDINPGAHGSFPVPLAISHGKLYFTANDGTHGTELWALNVTPTSVTVATSKSPVLVGGSVTFTATVASAQTGTLTGTVQFMDGTTLLGTGTVNSSGVATFATTSLTAGTHSITAVYGGDVNFANSTSAAIFEIVLAAAPDYTLTANPATATIRAGQSATFAITATADAYFNGTITFSCGTLPRGVTCSFSPTTLNPTSASPVVTTLTVSTTSQSAALVAPMAPAGRSNGMALWASLSGVGLFGCVLLGRAHPPCGKGAAHHRKRTLRKVVAVAVLAVALAVGLSGCGGGAGGSQNPNATPTGASTVQVTATATAGTTGGNTAAHQMTITVNVQ